MRQEDHPAATRGRANRGRGMRLGSLDQMSFHPSLGIATIIARWGLAGLLWLLRHPFLSLGASGYA